MRAVPILLLFTLVAEYSCTTLSWQPLGTQQGIVRNRWFAGFTHYNGELLLFGGEGSSQSSNGGVLGKVNILRAAILILCYATESHTRSIWICS